MTTIRKRSEVLEEVEELADFTMDVNPDLTLEEARSIVWEECPELYQEYVASPPEAPVVPVAKSTRIRTVADAIGDAVHAEADRQVVKLRERRTVEEIRADLWESVEGQQLYALARSDAGRQIYAGHVPVNKSSAFADAWSVLRHWLR